MERTIDCWLSARQAADYTGYTKRYILTAASAGQLEGYRIGVRGAWRFHRASLDAWLMGSTKDVV